MRIAVLGVGLIGGSVGMAAAERLGADVAGSDPDGEALRRAVARGAVTEPFDTVAQALQGAEAAICAAPVSALPGLVTAALDAAGTDCVVTDVGSTKRALVAAVTDPRFVGGHPLAGAETAGVAHARPDLFDGATWYLTPGQTTSGILYERLHRLLHGLGASVVAVDAADHDRALAAVSHLPHVLANVLAAQAAATLGSDPGEGIGRLIATGPSFRDATRVAGAPSAIWTDIYLSNRDALADQLEQTIDRLTAARDLLASGDADAVTAWNDAAAADRRALESAGVAGSELAELRVSLPNSPGVLARLALELGRAGVNIADMALYPAPDMRDGVVALWCERGAAQRAAELIDGLGHPVARADA